MRCCIFNCTRQTVVASEVQVAETGWARMKGLLGRSGESFGHGQGLWIVPSEGIHTIGMSFPIDVAYLDSKHRVIHIYHRLAPFRIAAMKLKAQSILELPAGALWESRTEVGDLLQVLVSEQEGGVQCAARA